MMALKSLILLYLLSSTSGSPDPGEPPPLFGEKTADPKNVTSVRDDGDIVHVTEAPVEEAVGNLTTVAEVEASNVTESIESIVLPEVGSAAKEHSASLAVFFLLFVLILSIFLLHLLLKVKFHYLPESLAMGNIISTYKCQVYSYVTIEDFIFSVPWSGCWHDHDDPSRAGDQEN